MPVALLNLCFFLLVLNIESAVSVCDIRVHTINFGCHLEWNCPDANPKTTYTVLSKTHGTSWVNVSGCIQISQQSCDLSHVFPNLNSYNFIRLASESLWINDTWVCDPINDSAAKFSPPSIKIFMANGGLWVTVNFPCSPSVSCFKDDEYYEEEEEMGCSCPLTEFKSLQATVTLYNKQNLSDTQAHTAEVMDEIPFKVEFGFLTPGQVYCAVANFTVEGVLASSPPSILQCVYIPANNESLIVVVVCAVLITLGLVFFLVWRQCAASSERPLPRSLVLDLHEPDCKLYFETWNFRTRLSSTLVKLPHTTRALRMTTFQLCPSLTSHSWTTSHLITTPKAWAMAITQAPSWTIQTAPRNLKS